MQAAASNWQRSNMASSSSGSTLEEILADGQLFESQIGISYAEGPLDSDESDLEVEVWKDDDQQGEDEQHSDDDETGDMSDDGTDILLLKHYSNLHVYRWWFS